MKITFIYLFPQIGLIKGELSTPCFPDNDAIINVGSPSLVQILISAAHVDHVWKWCFEVEFLLYTMALLCSL